MPRDSITSVTPFAPSDSRKSTSVHPCPLAIDLDHIMAHTDGLWENLRGQKLFITGGTGFVGQWLLESFMRANDELQLEASVTVLTRDRAAFEQKAPALAARSNLELHEGDVRTFQFPAGEYAACIHAATEADSHVMASAPLQAFDINVEGARQALEFARHAGVRRFLFTSSGAIYGNQPPELDRIPEHFRGGPDPIDTQSTYGIPGEAKRAAESLCILYGRQYGFESVIARCFTFVGPHLPLQAKFAIGNFIRDALAGGPIRIAGDGTPLRSYLYASDLTIWLWTLLFRGASGQAYNVGSDEAYSISQVAECVAQQLAVRPLITKAQRQDPLRPIHRYVPDITRARNELGLDVWTSLDAAIHKTLKFHGER
ncbi:MAG: NAD(P)-dependent oxidoreductase [Lacunisphaera sp.]